MMPKGERPHPRRCFQRVGRCSHDESDDKAVGDHARFMRIDDGVATSREDHR
jgi:hypothetical protein